MIKKYLFILFIISGNLFSMQKNNVSCFNATKYIEKNLVKLGWYGVCEGLSKELKNSKYSKVIFNHPKTIFDNYRIKLKIDSKKMNLLTNKAIERITYIVCQLKKLKFKIKDKNQFDLYSTTEDTDSLNLIDLTTPSWKDYARYLLSKIEKPKKKRTVGMSFVKPCFHKNPPLGEKNKLVSELINICNMFLANKIGDPNEFFPSYIDPLSIIDEETFKTLKNLKIIYLRGWVHGQDYDLLRTISRCCPRIKTIYVSKDPIWTKEECNALISGFKIGKKDLQIKEEKDYYKEEDRSKTN